MSVITDTVIRELTSIVEDFPVVLDQAIEDWAKFKLIEQLPDRGGLSESDRRTICQWFKDFDEFWTMLRPNFLAGADSAFPGSPSEIAVRADKFVSNIKSALRAVTYSTVASTSTALGIAPLVVAGIIIGGALGVTGVLWAIAYVRKQSNISSLIDEVAVGRIDESVLREAIESDQAGLFSGVASSIKWLLVAGLAFLVVKFIGDR